MKDYKPRLVDGDLRDGLSAMGGCAIEGPRACGKTATARQMAADEILLDVDREASALVQVDPRLLRARIVERGAPRDLRPRQEGSVHPDWISVVAT